MSEDRPVRVVGDVTVEIGVLQGFAFALGVFVFWLLIAVVMNTDMPPIAVDLGSQVVP